jgi:hypothetical protein
LLWVHADPDATEVTLPDHGQWARRYEVVLDTGQPTREKSQLDAGARLGLTGRSSVLLRVLE